MLKKVLNYDVGLDIFDTWPGWIRWVFALPISFGAYLLVYWIANLIVSFIINNRIVLSILVNRWSLTEDTVIGAIFMHVFFALIPLYIFYNIIPKYKIVFSSILSAFYLIIHGFMIIGGIYLIAIGEHKLLNYFFHSVLPSLLAFLAVIFLLINFKNDIKRNKESGTNLKTM